jgi:hypothetical protein
MFHKTCKFTVLLFLAFFTTFLSGQNSKSNEISEIYEFSNFNTLELSHAISVILVQSDNYRVAISFFNNIEF